MLKIEMKSENLMFFKYFHLQNEVHKHSKIYFEKEKIPQSYCLWLYLCIVNEYLLKYVRNPIHSFKILHTFAESPIVLVEIPGNPFVLSNSHIVHIYQKLNAPWPGFIIPNTQILTVFSMRVRHFWAKLDQK